MAKLHKILFGSAIVAFANLAWAQGATDAAGANSTMPAPTTVTGPDVSGSSSAGSAASGTAPVGTVAIPGTNPADSASNDPHVQRRQARKDAKEEYKAAKKGAKEQYKADKNAADDLIKQDAISSGR